MLLYFLGVYKTKDSEQQDHEQQEPFPVDLEIHWPFIYNERADARMQRHKYYDGNANDGNENVAVLKVFVNIPKVTI